jgi:hypothetical protein
MKICAVGKICDGSACTDPSTGSGSGTDSSSGDKGNLVKVYKLSAVFTATINYDVTAADLLKLEEIMKKDVFVGAKSVTIKIKEQSRRRLQNARTLETKVVYEFRDETLRTQALESVKTKVQTNSADLVATVAAKLDGDLKTAFESISIDTTSLDTQATEADEFVDCGDEETVLTELCKYGCVEECHNAIVDFKENLCPNYTPDEALAVIIENCDEGYIDGASQHSSHFVSLVLPLFFGAFGLRFM